MIDTSSGRRVQKVPEGVSRPSHVLTEFIASRERGLWEPDWSLEQHAI